MNKMVTLSNIGTIRYMYLQVFKYEAWFLVEWGGACFINVMIV